MNGLVATLGAILVLGAVVFGLRFLYGYRIENGAIEFVLFQIVPIYHLPVDHIESIRKASWNELGIDFRTIRLGNLLARECVLIQKRRGWFRRLVITPGDADGFVEQVVAIQQHGSPGGS